MRSEAVGETFSSAKLLVIDLDSLPKLEKPTSLVVDCPTCHRTIWAGSNCDHGERQRALAIKRREALEEAAKQAEKDRRDKNLRKEYGLD